MTISPYKSMRSLLLAIPAVSIAAPIAAQANDVDPEGGLYVSVQAGVTSPSDDSFNGIQAPVAASPGAPGAPASVELEFDEDFVGTIAVGYRLPKLVFGIFQPSVELEYSYAEAGIDGGSFNGGDQTFSGENEVNTFSINYQSDIRWSDDQKLIPFFGGGIGIADVDAEVGYFPNNGVATSPTFALTGSSTEFTYQSNIGLQYVLTDRIELQGRVRYQRIDGVNLERRFVGGGADAFNANVSGDYETVSFLAGVRVRL